MLQYRVMNITTLIEAQDPLIESMNQFIKFTHYICHGLGLLLQYWAIAPYLWSETAAFYAVALFTVIYIYVLLVASYNNSSVQSFNSPCLRTEHFPLQRLSVSFQASKSDTGPFTPSTQQR